MVATAGDVIGGVEVEAVFEEAAGIEQAMVIVEVIGGGEVVVIREEVRAGHRLSGFAPAQKPA